MHLYEMQENLLQIHFKFMQKEKKSRVMDDGNAFSLRFCQLVKVVLLFLFLVYISLNCSLDDKMPEL